MKALAPSILGKMMTIMPYNNCRPFMLCINDYGLLLIPPSRTLYHPNQSHDHQTSEKCAYYYTGHNEETLREITTILKNHSQNPVIIIADTTAINFQSIEFPDLWFWDKRKLQANRQDAFSENCFTSTVFPTTKDSAIIAALPNDASFADNDLKQSPILYWKEKIEQLPNLFLGITILPLSAAHVISALDKKFNEEWAILLTYHSSNCFRQTITYKGQFIYSRLTQPIDINANPDFVMSSLAMDIQSTKEYLGRFGLTKEATVTLIGIMSENLIPFFDKAYFPVHHRNAYTPHSASQILDLDFSVQNDHDTSDLLICSMALRDGFIHTIQDSATINDIIHSNINSLAYPLSLLFLLLCLIESFFIIHDLEKLNNAQTQREVKIAEVQNYIASLEEEILPTTQNLGNLRLAIEKKRFFESSHDKAFTLYEFMAQSLDNTIKATKWNWTLDRADSDEVDIGLKIINPMSNKWSPEKQKTYVQNKYTKLTADLTTKLIPINYFIKEQHLPYIHTINTPLANGIQIDETTNARLIISLKTSP